VRPSAAIALSVLLLAGCTAAPSPPAPPTAADVRAYNQRMLDLTYANLGLENATSKLESADGVDPTNAALSDCMGDAGVSNFSWGWSSDDGYRLYAGGSDPTLPLADRVAFYRCLAEHPADLLSTGDYLSDAERDYLRDYWANWVTPCIVTSGYELNDDPVFAAASLSPYNRVVLSESEASETGPSGLPIVLATLEHRCGPPFGVIDRLAQRLL